MPARSSGCFTCRKRKVRCDERRPGCQRCATHGVPCPGYRDPAPGELAFEHATIVTVRKAQTKNGKGPNPDDGSNTNSSKSHHSTPIMAVATVGNTRTSPVHTSLSVQESSDDTSDGDRSISRASSSPSDFDFADSNIDLPVLPPTINSSRVQREQFYETFMDMYVPKRLMTEIVHWQMLRRLLAMPDAPPVLAHALDALSLVQVGSVRQDPVLLRQALRSYTASVGLLARRLARAATQHDDCVLAATSVLALCEYYDDISQGNSGSTQHLDGGELLLAARGPESVTSETAVLMYGDLRHGALNSSLIRRRASLLARPEWRALGWRLPSSDSSVFFYDLALQVPIVLERYDALKSKCAEVVAEIDSILELAYELDEHLAELWQFVEKNDLFELVDISLFPTFTSVCSDRTITRAYLFSNFVIGYFISMYANTMYALRAAIRDLHTARQAADRTWNPPPEKLIREEQLLELIMMTCRCLPFFVEPISSAVGQMGMFLPIRTIMIYATENAHPDLYRWVLEIRMNAFRKGMRPPYIEGDQLLVQKLAETLSEEANMFPRALKPIDRVLLAKKPPTAAGSNLPEFLRLDICF